jgi:hypothetical protein
MNENPLARPPMPTRGKSPFVPAMLVALALTAWFGFQTYQLVRERRQVAQLRAGQDGPVEAAAKVRAALDSVATATALLADRGNANARVIVEELRRRGITINQPGAASSVSAR